jgi:hypothetical protein
MRQIGNVFQAAGEFVVIQIQSLQVPGSQRRNRAVQVVVPHVSTTHRANNQSAIASGTRLCRHTSAAGRECWRAAAEDFPIASCFAIVWFTGATVCKHEIACDGRDVAYMNTVRRLLPSDGGMVPTSRLLLSILCSGRQAAC